jgi:Helicase conserved C-terminal domain
MAPDSPLIIQCDRTALLEVEHPGAGACRAQLARFAELEKSPEHVHTYRITPLSLWNARAAGLPAQEMKEALIEFSRFPVPAVLLTEIEDQVARYGRLRLIRGEPGLLLVTEETAILAEAPVRDRWRRFWVAGSPRTQSRFHRERADGSSRPSSRSDGRWRILPGMSRGLRSISRFAR